MNLFDEMDKKVELYVKHYKEDYYIHDRKILQREAAIGRKFYWLLRECGTQLAREDQLIIDSDVWNVSLFFTHYTGKNCKLYEITITGIKNGEIEGKLKSLPFPKSLDRFAERKVPKLYTIHCPQGEFIRPWNPDIRFVDMVDFLKANLGTDATDNIEEDIYLTFSF